MLIDKERILYSICEGYNKQSIANMPTQKLGTLYRWLKFGNGNEHIKNGDSVLKSRRDLIGSELGKRARGNDDDAKRYLNNRMSNNMDKYGEKTPMKTTPAKKSLSQKIMRMLKGKMK